MENETKVTYGVIALMIIFLGGLAYILQPGDVVKTLDDQKKTSAAVEVPLKNKLLEAGIASTTITKKTTMDQQKFTSATITTNKGIIEVELEQSKPLTTKNFGTLANSNFYNGVRFHRVIKGFMIQAGDPLSKDIQNQSAWGTGGPGYKFQDELTGKETYSLGTLAMANSGPNTNGSQFFIVTANPSVALPPSYTVFGKVTKGIEVALAIENVQTTSSDRPLQEIVIEKIEVK
jgi:cyclophilin family peptidyl-prolyl cis-trans isomerase